MPFPNIGAPELIIILIIALIVLGPGRLPDVAASLGKSLREFRKAASDVSDAGKLDSPPAAAPTTPVPNESVALPPPNPSVPAAPADPNTLAAAPAPNQLADVAPPSTPAGDPKP